MTDRRRGIVLVTVLWSIALLSALAMAASMNLRGFTALLALHKNRVQAEALLVGGLESAAHILNTLGDIPLTDVEITITLSGGSVRVELSDEGGRVDIGKAPVEVLAALFRFVGAQDRDANAIASAIVNSRKSVDGKVLVQPFTDLYQIRWLPGVRPEWLTALEPLTTVFGSETVNPSTAPQDVIAAMPGVDASRVGAFMQMRREFPEDANRSVGLLGAAQAYFEVKTRPVASVKLTATLKNGFTRAAHAVILSTPEEERPYRVLVWRYLPSKS